MECLDVLQPKVNKGLLAIDLQVAVVDAAGNFVKVDGPCAVSNLCRRLLVHGHIVVRLEMNELTHVQLKCLFTWSRKEVLGPALGQLPRRAVLALLALLDPVVSVTGLAFRVAGAALAGRLLSAGHALGKRRCGWFDGVLVRQTIKISGIHGIALTKLDVLDELEEIKMCIGYEINGKKIDYLPAASEDQFNIKPIYKSFPGWKSKTQGIRNFKDLPDNAKKYIHALEDFIEAKISSISTSPERDDTILVEDPFGN